MSKCQRGVKDIKVEDDCGQMDMNLMPNRGYLPLNDHAQRWPAMESHVVRGLYAMRLLAINCEAVVSLLLKGPKTLCKSCGINAGDFSGSHDTTTLIQISH